MQETELFKHVDKFLSSVGYEDNLPYVAAKAFSQGAQILSGTELDELCCHETCVKCIKGMLVLELMDHNKDPCPKLSNDVFLEVADA